LANTTLGPQTALSQGLGIDVLGGSQFIDRNPGDPRHHHQASRLLPYLPSLSDPLDKLLNLLVFGQSVVAFLADIEVPVVVDEHDRLRSSTDR
jgi:hypothetical protein